MWNARLLLVTLWLFFVTCLQICSYAHNWLHLQESMVTELGKKFLVFMQPKVHRRVHNGLRLGPVLHQTDALKICTPWSSESYSSSSHPRLDLPTQVFRLKCYTYFCYTCMFRPLNLHSFDHTNTRTVWWTAQIINPLKPELNPICYLLALLGDHHFLHVSRIRVKLLTFRRLMSYIYIWSTHSWCF